jgi:ornithine carbamoyltransferase
VRPAAANPTGGSLTSYKDFLTVDAWDRPELDRVLKLAQTLKAEAHAGRVRTTHAGQTVALVFHKPSLRTRVSFEVAINQLGGRAVYLTDAEIGVGSREPVEDVARVLSGYVKGIVVRTFAHRLIEDLAKWATIPVINALTDLSHPCQILGDLLTALERGFALDGLAAAFIGDGNNVANSWIEAAARYRLDLRIACPEGYDPDASTLARARSAGAHVRVVREPAEAAEGAQVLYTDVWASMGQEAEREARAKAFRGYQVNADLLRRARGDAIVMHCLPAHRGDEITAEVMEGAHSVVFDEAENRLHVQRAILATLLPPTAA